MNKSLRRHAIAGRLLMMAARRSVQTPFGWAHEDCAVLEEAARILKGEPETIRDDDRADGVLSNN